jgi:hypothetical protein
VSHAPGHRKARPPFKNRRIAGWRQTKHIHVVPKIAAACAGSISFYGSMLRSAPSNM